eukprot:2991558-Pyramimonas_sp.AAC.1
MGDITHVQAAPQLASATQIEEQLDDAIDRLSAMLQKGGGASTTARPTTYSTASVKETTALLESSDEAPRPKA